MQPGVKGTEYSDRGGAGFGRVRRFFFAQTVAYRHADEEKTTK